MPGYCWPWGLGKYVEQIPHAVLAGILMKVGGDIIDWKFLKRAHRIQCDQLVVMVITLGLTVFLDLVTAIAIGLIAAGMVAARQVERLELDSVVSTPLLDQTFLYDSPEEAAVANDGDEFAARVGVVGMRGRNAWPFLGCVFQYPGQHHRRRHQGP